MKAQVGGYARAKDVSDAIRLLAQADGMGRVLAGGQSLVAALNMGLTGGDLLVDITALSDLQGVREDGDTLIIGALTRHSQIAVDPLIAEHVPLLAQAAPLIAHEAIRNRGTIGGSLAHADPAAEYPACVVALDAVIQLQGPDGTRQVAAIDFFHAVFETAMKEGEILTGIALPKASAGERHIIREATRRAGDYAIAGLAVVVCDGAHRIAVFGAGPTPILCIDAMEKLDAGDIDGAVSALSDALDPPSDTQGSAAYRRHLADVLLRRIVTELGEAA